MLTLAMSIAMLVGACSPSLTASPSAGSSAAPQGSGGAPASEAAKAKIRIGSDDTSELELMGEIYAQLLENAGYEVERKFGAGSDRGPIPLIDSGEVDLVAEYVGSGLGLYDKSKITGDGEANATALQEALKSKNITVLGITPGEDTNAFVIRKETSDSLSLTKMSQLAAVQDQLKWGLPTECDTDPLCKDALVEYGITYPPAQRAAFAACDAPMASALEDKTIDVAELCSTQPAIAQFGFVVLEDELDTQPAQNIAPLVRNDYLATADAAAFQALLDGASAKMTTAELTKLRGLVDVDKKAVGDVAKEWLTQQRLLK